ncbi:MAG: hypothetical protein ACHQF4_08805 [Sphingobacteriales bacterium]
MKLFITVIFFLFAFSANAQNKYSNKIGEVKELNIYGNNANVVIGKIIITNTIDPPSIKLLQSFQSPTPQQDGFYFTAFAFGTNSVLPLYNVDLHLKFNHPVDSLQEGGISYGLYPSNAKNGLSADKLSYSLTGSEIHAMIKGKAVFVVLIKSKYKIETTITGAGANSD